MRSVSNPAPRHGRGGAPEPDPISGWAGATRLDIIDPAMLLRVFLKPQEEVGLVLKVEADPAYPGVATVTISLPHGETLGPLAFPSSADALAFCQKTADAAKAHDAGAVVVLELAEDL